MRSFNEFQEQVKTIEYKNAIPHTVYQRGVSKKIPGGRAVPVRSRSSSGGDGGDGE